MSQLTNLSESLVKTFNGVLKSFNSKELYEKSPPKGPPENWASLSNDELEALQFTEFGEDFSKDRPYSKLELILQDGVTPKKVEFPSADLLSDVNISAIDGSNQRIERSAFHFIIARAVIVNFRYSKAGLKPYFYHKLRDVSAVTVVDGNVFDLDKLNISTSNIIEAASGETENIRSYLNNSDSPLFVKYDINESNSSPSSHTLGWAVKLMQTLELQSLQDVQTDSRNICIKDGPLFSPSVSFGDAKHLLSIIHTWKDQIVMGCSKRVRDSRLLIQALQENRELRDYWFKGQNLTDKTIANIASDSLILPRILKPGERTPFMLAIPIARQKYVNEESGGDPDLTPISCYYLSRTSPHTYIRLEFPKLFYDRDPKKVEEAIQVISWQHELGRHAPLVQLLADQRCQLGSEKLILERQTNAALLKFNLDFPQEY